MKPPQREAVLLASAVRTLTHRPARLRRPFAEVFRQSEARNCTIDPITDHPFFKGTIAADDLCSNSGHNLASAGGMLVNSGLGGRSKKRTNLAVASGRMAGWFMAALSARHLIFFK